MAVKLESALTRLREGYIKNIADQRELIRAGDATRGNRCAKRYTENARKLLEIGEQGIDTLAALLHHEDIDVRVLTACILLTRKTEAALSVLRAEAGGASLAAYGAKTTLKRWEETGLGVDI